jgi:NADH-quinone oxidoreductase subunit N
VLPGSREDVALAEATEVQTEIYPLALFSLGGMMLFPAANNLLLMFIALEVLSLPLYLMAGLARRRRLLSQEAAVKYFLLGAFAVRVLPLRRRAALRLRRQRRPRRGARRHDGRGQQRGPAVPRPGDAGGRPALQGRRRCLPGRGRPTSTRARHAGTALMAACTKISAFGALLRVFYVGFGRAEWDWRPMLWAVAILTMVSAACWR